MPICVERMGVGEKPTVLSHLSTVLLPKLNKHSKRSLMLVVVWLYGACVSPFLVAGITGLLLEENGASCQGRARAHALRFPSVRVPREVRPREGLEPFSVQYSIILPVHPALTT